MEIFYPSQNKGGEYTPREECWGGMCVKVLPFPMSMCVIYTPVRMQIFSNHAIQPIYLYNDVDETRSTSFIFLYYNDADKTRSTSFIFG